jgi:hypothetical protein
MGKHHGGWDTLPPMSSCKGPSQQPALRALHWLWRLNWLPQWMVAPESL